MQFLGQEVGGFAHQFGVRYLERAVHLNHYPARIALAGCMFTGQGRKGVKAPERAIELLTGAAVQVSLRVSYLLSRLSTQELMWPLQIWTCRNCGERIF